MTAESQIHQNQQLPDPPHRLQWAVKGVACVAVLLLFVFLILLSIPPFETRRALLSCIRCGNVREVIIVQRWWQIHRVRCIDTNEFPIEAGHTHRWFQYNSKSQAWYYTGWTRDKYETGEWRWQGKVNEESLSRPQDNLREEWLK